MLPRQTILRTSRLWENWVSGEFKSKNIPKYLWLTQQVTGGLAYYICLRASFGHHNFFQLEPRQKWYPGAEGDWLTRCQLRYPFSVICFDLFPSVYLFQSLLQSPLSL